MPFGVAEHHSHGDEGKIGIKFAWLLTQRENAGMESQGQFDVHPREGTALFRYCDGDRQCC
jgi:hypothetical protein